jgi:hypothetical protein
VAEATPVTLTGAQDHLASGGAHDSGATKVIPAGPGEMEWAYYRLPSNGYPALSVELNLLLDGPAYVGLADYTRGCWEFGPAVAEPDVTLELGTKHLSPAGNIYVVVVAHDAVTVTVLSVTIVLDQPGWLVTEVQSGTGYLGVVQLFSDGPGGLPHIACFGGAQGAVRLMRTAVIRPSDSADWDSQSIDVGTSAQPLHAPLEAEFIGAGPALAYFAEPEEDQWQLRYTYASVAEPDSGDWTMVNAGGVGGYGSQQLSLCEYLGAPSIAHEHYVNGIWLARSSDSTPDAASWDESRIAFDAFRPAMAVVDGRLAVCYFSGSGVSLVAGYSRALNAAPSGIASWDAHELDWPHDFNFYGASALVATPYDLEPVPLMMLVWSDRSYPRYFCADTAQPVSEDWHATDTDSGADVGSAAADLCLVAGRPAAAYYLSDRGSLQLAWAEISAPWDDADWQVTIIESGVDVSDVSLAEVGGAPALAYYEITTNTLKYAYPD